MYNLFTMSSKNVQQAFGSQGGILRTSEAIALGIHPRMLYALRDRGEIEQLSRGLYRLASLPPLTRPDLVTVALRVPKAVLCLSSALELHDLTTALPHAIHIALPRGTKTPRLDHPPLSVYRFSGAALTDGIETHTIDSVPIRVYGVAKTVVDCFRLRSRVGKAIAIAALREALTSQRVTPAALLRQARACRIESVMLPYVEGLA
jgi:predicted transcriptional regulator of viral defense system